MINKVADHAELIAALLKLTETKRKQGRPDPERLAGTCEDAANLIDWQARELRHLARLVGSRDRRIADLEALVSKLEQPIR